MFMNDMIMHMQCSQGVKGFLTHLKEKKIEAK